MPPTKEGDGGGENSNTNSTKKKTLAFVSVGGERKLLVFSADGVRFGSPPPKLLKEIPIPAGDEPHAVWPSGDGTTVWVGLQIANAAVAVDTEKLEVVEGSRVEIGAQSPMGMVYVPGAASAVKKVAAKAGATAAAGSTSSFLSAEKAKEQSKAFHFELVSPSSSEKKNGNKGNNTVVLTSLVINQQSAFVDALEAVVAGLRPGEDYALCLTGEKETETERKKKEGSKGEKSPLSSCEIVVALFKGGLDNAANVATVGPFTDLLFEKSKGNKDGKQQQQLQLQQKRFFVVVPKKKEDGFGGAVQVQAVQ